MKLLLEGLDRLGKTTIVKEVQEKLGFHITYHCEKPKKLKRYTGSAIGCPLKTYQRATFIQMFKLLEADVNIIFDRAHLGETVYGPLSRGYDGHYVFDLERKYNTEGVRLVLLYADADFTVEDDGNSLNEFSLRPSEQEEFIRAFNRSSIVDKKMIKVNQGNKFRPIEDIIKEII